MQSLDFFYLSAETQLTIEDLQTAASSVNEP